MLAIQRPEVSRDSAVGRDAALGGANGEPQRVEARGGAGRCLSSTQRRCPDWRSTEPERMALRRRERGPISASESSIRSGQSAAIRSIVLFA